MRYVLHRLPYDKKDVNAIGPSIRFWSAGHISCSSVESIRAVCQGDDPLGGQPPYLQLKA